MDKKNLKGCIEKDLVVRKDVDNKNIKVTNSCCEFDPFNTIESMDIADLGFAYEAFKKGKKKTAKLIKEIIIHRLIEED